MTRIVPSDFHDESVPAVPDMTPGYPIVCLAMTGFAQVKLWM
jgi:hypothetical protein